MTAEATQKLEATGLFVVKKKERECYNKATNMWTGCPGVDGLPPGMKLTAQQVMSLRGQFPRNNNITVYPLLGGELVGAFGSASPFLWRVSLPEDRCVQALSVGREGLSCADVAQRL